MSDSIPVVGDFGTIFRIRFIDQDGAAVDISDADTKTIVFVKPDDPVTAVEKTGTFTTDGTDGLLEYTTVDSDIDAAGTWYIEGRIEKAASYQYTTLQGVFEVRAALPVT